LLHIDAKDLACIHGLNGFHRFGLDLLLQLDDQNGLSDRETSRSFYVVVTESDYRRASIGGLEYSLSVPAPGPGDYQVRAFVGDAISGNIGYACQFLDVPDVSRGQLALSGIALMDEGHADPLADTGVQLGVNDDSPAMRVFKPGQTVTFVYGLFNPLIGADKKPAVEARTRLFRNGRLVFEGKPILLAMPTGGDAQRYSIRGRISLAPSMEPGDYVYHVTVTDKLAGEKPRQATQSIDFRLQP
jgi:hypothetical protein